MPFLFSVEIPVNEATLIALTNFAFSYVSFTSISVISATKLIFDSQVLYGKGLLCNISKE